MNLMNSKPIINDYFSRQEQLAYDPYLETREKEDAFLQRVLDTIREGVQAYGVGGIAAFASLLQSVQSEPASKESTMRDEDLDAAMDFIKSL